MGNKSEEGQCEGENMGNGAGPRVIKGIEGLPNDDGDQGSLMVEASGLSAISEGTVADAADILARMQETTIDTENISREDEKTCESTSNNNQQEPGKIIMNLCLTLLSFETLFSINIFLLVVPKDVEVAVPNPRTREHLAIFRRNCRFHSRPESVCSHDSTLCRGNTFFYPWPPADYATMTFISSVIGYSLEFIKTYNNYYYKLPKQKGILVYNEPHFGESYPLIIWMNECNDNAYLSEYHKQQTVERYFCLERVLNCEKFANNGNR